MDDRGAHVTKAYIDLGNLAHNVGLLQELVGARPLWPAIKANAYGHGAESVGRHLVRLGYRTLCVAHASEAVELAESGVAATFVVMSATLPEDSECFVAHRLEPAVCTMETVEALARAAARAGRQVSVHLKVDTGMARIGIRPEEVRAFLESSRRFPEIKIKGLMSHFPRADEADKAFSNRQIEVFTRVCEIARAYGVGVCHMANSAAIFDLPEAHLDAVRPGISIYGLRPSATILNSRCRELRPVLQWKTRVTFLKQVPAGTGLSYGHTYRTERQSLIATVPVGYGDGLSRLLSNRMEFLIDGARCPQVGTITMDQSLVDVTALGKRVEVGDEVVVIGRQGAQEVTADELADRLGTINYEIVTAIAQRVERVVVEET